MSNFDNNRGTQGSQNPNQPKPIQGKPLTGKPTDSHRTDTRTNINTQPGSKPFDKNAQRPAAGGNGMSGKPTSQQPWQQKGGRSDDDRTSH